jgi:hypothetical protein
MEAASSFDDGPLGGGGGASSSAGGGMDGDGPAPTSATSSSGGGGGAVVAAAAAAAAAASAAANVAQENVAELHFGGPEFEGVTILSNAQVAVILQVSASSSIQRDEELNEVYRKTQKYVTRFNSMTNPEKEHQELVDELDNLQEYVCTCFFDKVLSAQSCRLKLFANLTFFVIYVYLYI